MSKSSKRSSPIPPGAIFLDDLLYRYLPAAGRSKFYLESNEIRQYAHLALDKVIRKYGLRTHSPEALWECVQLGRAHVLLLPDRPCEVHASSEQMSFVVGGVGHVPQTARRVLLNLIMDEEVRPSESRRKK